MSFEVMVDGKKLIKSDCFITNSLKNRINVEVAENFKFRINIVLDRSNTDKTGKIKRLNDDNEITYNCSVDDSVNGIGIKGYDHIANVSGKKWFISFWCAFVNNDKDIIMITYSLYEET